MSRSPSIATLALAALLAAALAAVGCSSSKKVSTTPPPPPAPEQTQTEAPPPPPPPPSSEEQTEVKMSLGDAFFDFDDASLRADAKTVLENNARYLESHGSTKAIVEGHCDERGSVEYNLALGERRAKAAKEFLVSYGIAAVRLTTISYGKERPFDPGHDESSWSKNRRAHFVAK
ncbi:MAG TPA: peptidoglycan-associated lipoprotein Pal [Candidatus Eisenbacteria bacterium]|nr:peptidoglycan-associated lipoprotein Pal [Candidatus Eisenbacteria bacterium]